MIIENLSANTYINIIRSCLRLFFKRLCDTMRFYICAPGRLTPITCCDILPFAPHRRLSNLIQINFVVWLLQMLNYDPYITMRNLRPYDSLVVDLCLSVGHVASWLGHVAEIMDENLPALQ